MRTEMNPASLTYLSLITGLLYIFLGAPMAMGKVKPNCIYGFRTQKTFSSPTIWYKANVFAGKAFIVCGLVVLVLGTGYAAIVARFGIGKAAIGFVAIAIEMVPFLIALRICFRYLATL